MKFEFLNKYIEQNEEINAKRKAMEADIKEAETKIPRFKAEYQSLMEESVKEGKDEDAKMAELSDKINDAEKEVRRKRDKLNAFHAVDKAKIKPDDIVDKFNNEYLPRYKQEKFRQVLDKLIETKC